MSAEQNEEARCRARCIHKRPREPVRVPARPVEMTTSGTVSGDTDANVTQAGGRDKSDTVVSTLEESYSGQILGGRTDSRIGPRRHGRRLESTPT